MKAIVQNRYGSADVLEFADIDPPVPGDDEASTMRGRETPAAR